jgi:hypothetical protein
MDLYDIKSSSASPCKDILMRFFLPLFIHDGILQF